MKGEKQTTLNELYIYVYTLYVKIYNKKWQMEKRVLSWNQMEQKIEDRMMIIEIDEYT